MTGLKEMSTVKTTLEFHGTGRPRLTSTRLLASAQSLAQRAQLSLESLGCASNLFLLGGVGVGLLGSYIGAVLLGHGRSAAVRTGADPR